MIFTLELKDLPFELLEDQIIYTECGYDEDVNRYIKEHYASIREYFKYRGKEFIYLPMLVEELKAEDVVRYNAPYAERLNDVVEVGSDFLLQFMVHPENKMKVPPSLVYYYKHEKGNSIAYHGVALTNDSDYKETDDLSNILAEIIAEESSVIKFSLNHDSFFEKAKEAMSNFSRKVVEDEYDEPEACLESAMPNRCIKLKKEEDKFDDETLRMMEEAKALLEKLRKVGVSEYILQKKVIHGEEKLSRLFISKDYHIFLTDYNNQEIVMRPLPKMLFFLYLLHPEGIRYKCLIDYQDEMLEIYKAVKQGFYNLVEAKNSISNICNSTGNSASEKVFHAKAAFELVFKDRLAQEYTIRGPQGGIKKIDLPRYLVTWEKPIRI